MMNLNTMDTEDFKKKARKMLPNDMMFVYVEGNNKVFYQNITELFACHVDGGGNCERVKEIIAEKLSLGESNNIGIIDKDYNDSSPQNIFMLNFYSIENIALSYMPQFNNLKNSIYRFFNDTPIDMMLKKLLLGNFTRHPETNKHSPFSLCLSREIQASYHPYLELTIIDFNSFIKYQNLKRPIERYATYYTRTESDKSLKKYFKILHQYLPENSLEYILISSHYNEICKII